MRTAASGSRKTRPAAAPRQRSSPLPSEHKPIRTGPHTAEVPGVYRGVDYRLEVSKTGPFSPFVWAARLLAIGPAVLVSGALVMQTTFWGEDPREAVTRAREAVQEFIDETKADNGEDEKRGRRRRVAVG